MKISSFTGSFGHYLCMAWSWLRWRFIILLVLNLLAALVESIGILLFLPFLSQLGIPATDNETPSVLLDLFQTFGENLTLASGLLVLVGIFSLKGILFYVIITYRSMLLNTLQLDLREELIRRFSELDYQYAGQQSTGYFGHLVVNETHTARTAINALCSLLGAAITVVLLIGAALILDPGLSIFVLISSGISLIILKKLSAWARGYSSTITQLEGRLSEFMIEALQAFSYLKATQRFNILDQRLTTTSQRTRKERNRLDRVLAINTAVQEPLLVMLIAMMFFGSIHWLGRSVSTVLVSLAFFYRCMIEMRFLQGHWQTVSSCSGGLDAIWRALINMKKQREDFSGKLLPAEEAALELKHIHFKYDREPVLNDLSLSIPAKEITALVGASGAGKSTMMGLLTGILRPTEGEMTLGGQSFQDIDLKRYRENIGYVPQEPVIISGSILENITLQPDDSPERHQADVEHAARLAHCHDFISDLPQGYHTRLYERGNTLSGGQRQRLAIARELYRRPRLLLLDEASSALDAGSETQLRESLEELRGTVTMVLISHRMSTIKHADSIHVLDQGSIVASGTFEELIENNAVFRHMCEQQHLV